MKTRLLDTDCVSMFEKAMKYELLNAQVYRHLWSQMQDIGYKGASKYFLAEIADEEAHFQKHVNFLNDMGIAVDVPIVVAQKGKVSTLKDALVMAYEMEVDLLKYYREFAKEEGMEYPEILEHLMFYLNVQRTTVGEYGDLLARLELVKDDTCGILLIDQEMGG